MTAGRPPQSRRPGRLAERHRLQGLAMTFAAVDSDRSLTPLPSDCDDGDEHERDR